MLSDNEKAVAILAYYRSARDFDMDNDPPGIKEQALYRCTKYLCEYLGINMPDFNDFEDFMVELDEATGRMMNDGTFK